ncbi:MAG TPA: NUDIX hydrolase [Limnobacter sp.]|nr:NUDIX hydrolase [Limnobacter sp.]
MTVKLFAHRFKTTKRVARFAAVLFLVACSSPAAGPPAGLAAYACHAGVPHFLLAFDPHPARRAWATLGGGAQGNETPVQTALREFREESNCAYAEEELNTLVVAGPSVSPGVPFHLYAAEVAYKSPEDIASPRACVDIERSQWVWVKQDDLMQAIATQTDTVPVAVGTPATITLWSRGRESLQKALDDGTLPAYPNTTLCMDKAR